MSVTAIVSSAQRAKLEVIAKALAIPDVYGLENLEEIEPYNLVSLIKSLEAQVEEAEGFVDELLAPLRAVSFRARKIVTQTIVRSGGTALPHDLYDVDKHQKYERRRDVATLRSELSKAGLPDDELAEIVFIESVNVKGAFDPEAVAKLEAGGAKVKWECDLRKADKYAKKYGGEIAKIIERATESVTIGDPYVVITPKESAMKVVGK